MPSDLSPLWISLKTALFATVVTFFVGIAAAYWMQNYRGKGKFLIEGLFVAPLILPPTVVGFLLLLLFGKNGAFGQLLSQFEISVVFTWYGAVIAATIVAFPLMYRTTLGAFDQIDVHLLQVARSLGASEWTVFWRILLPLSIPGILAGTTLAFARALGEFGATLMLAGNIPGQTQTIPMAIYFAVESGAIAEAWFWAIVILGISLSGILAVQLWQDSRKNRKNKSIRREPRSTVPVQSFDAAATLGVWLQKQLGEFELTVAFEVDRRPLGVLGESGAGKSMMLRCIAGIETPNKGRIVLNGRVLFDSAKKINVPSRDRRIGFVPQNYALFPHMTVAQNIAFGLPKGLSKSAIDQQIRSQLAAVQLTDIHYAVRYPHQLSGGQQQRVALARALASQPEALLLDEPFSALDTFLRTQLEQQMITRLSTYTGVTLLVTHALEEAYRICPNLTVIESGRVIAHGTKHTIFEQPGTVSVARLTGCKNFSRAVKTNAQTLHAIDWNCSLQVLEAIPNQLAFVGIRAHQIQFLESGDFDNLQPNVFSCWLASTSETPHRMTLYLKINAPATHELDYELQAEVFKEKWIGLKARSLPWRVKLDPLKLMLLEN